MTRNHVRRVNVATRGRNRSQTLNKLRGFLVLSVVLSAALLIHVEGMAPVHTTVLVMPIPVLVTESPASVNAIVSVLIDVRVLDSCVLYGGLTLYKATDDGVAAHAQVH